MTQWPRAPRRSGRIDRISRRQVDKFAERRAQLAESALLTLSELGYARTSLREIAQNSEFSHGVLHYYFRDKVDLITHCVREYKARCVTRYDQIVATATHRRRAADRLCRRPGADHGRGRRLHRLWYDLRSQSMFEASFREDVAAIDESLERMIWRIVSRYAELAGSAAVGVPGHGLCDLRRTVPARPDPAPVRRRRALADELAVDGREDAVPPWSAALRARRPERYDSRIVTQHRLRTTGVEAPVTIRNHRAPYGSRSIVERTVIGDRQPARSVEKIDAGRCRLLHREGQLHRDLRRTRLWHSNTIPSRQSQRCTSTDRASWSSTVSVTPAELGHSR